jgi:manganese-transporting ATPase
VKKIIEPCGLHCIKMRHLGVRIGEQVILEDVNMHIHCGTLTAIIGRNGAGKTTLIRAILDDIPHEGQIDFRDTENGNIRKLKIGYVPQALNIEKRTPLSVYDLIASYQSNAPVFLYKKKRLYREILEALQVFEVENLIDAQVCNLSGGQLQRVLLSMAVIDEPNLLLLDEPVSGIDQNGMELFYRTMDYLKKNFDLAIVLISHDLNYVKKYADKVLLLDRTVLKQGSPKEVFESRQFQEVFETEKEGRSG